MQKKSTQGEKEGVRRVAQWKIFRGVRDSVVSGYRHWLKISKSYIYNFKILGLRIV